MALKVFKVVNTTTLQESYISFPMFSYDSDAVDYYKNVRNNFFAQLVNLNMISIDNNGILVGLKTNVRDGNYYETTIKSLIPPEIFLLYGFRTYANGDIRLLANGHTRSIINLTPAGIYTINDNYNFVVTNNRTFNSGKNLIPYYDINTVAFDSDYVNATASYSGSGLVYEAKFQFNMIYYNVTTQRIKSIFQKPSDLHSVYEEPILTDIDIYVGPSTLVKPKPISPDEVDTTNEQVGNDINYGDVHVDVDVIVPTNDNEENFSTSTITDTNIVSVYALTNSEVRDFSTYIWSNASQGLWQALAGQLQNPMDVILSLHTIPYANSDGTFVFPTQTSNIALAGIDSGIASRKVLKDNFQDFVGTVNLNSFIRHNFVDFPPYTELSIYLPYLGYVDLDLNDFRDRVGDDDTLGLHYIVEPMTGNFIAKLTSFKKNYKGTRDDATSSLNGSVMYSFSGNMARQLPLANRHFDILGGLAGIGSSLLMGGVQATMAKKPIGGIVGGVAGAVGSVIDMMTPKVSHNGNLGGNFGYLDSNVARIIMRSTPYYIPSNYGLTTGYVVNSYYSSFANLLGLVVIENWIPKNMSRATLEEITELEKLLKEGVYFGDGIWNETEEQESD